MFKNIFVTFFYLGKIKFAPGTFGSLGAIPIIYLLQQYYIDRDYIVANICFMSFISFYAVKYINIYMKETKQHDPKEVVIDEVVGMWLAVFLIQMYNLLFNIVISDYLILISSFILFRFFDIFKPWPVSYFDGLDSGFGVLMDDIAAGVMSLLGYIVIYNIVIYV